jgi:hypothetical protein
MTNPRTKETTIKTMAIGGSAAALALVLFIGEKLVLTRVSTDVGLLLPAPGWTLEVIAVPALLAGALIAVLGRRLGGTRDFYGFACLAVYLVGAALFAPRLFFTQPPTPTMSQWLSAAVLTLIHPFTWLLGLIPMVGATAVMTSVLRNPPSQRLSVE